jgi:hypothetical protein
MAAERAAEAVLSDAKKTRDRMIEEARSAAQAVDRRTDRRIETCRTAYCRATAALVEAANSEDPWPGVEDPGHDRHRSMERAAREIAQRLIGRA